jgi:hypothetical protein
MKAMPPFWNAVSIDTAVIWDAFSLHARKSVFRARHYPIHYPYVTPEAGPLTQWIKFNTNACCKNLASVSLLAAGDDDTTRTTGGIRPQDPNVSPAAGF